MSGSFPFDTSGAKDFFKDNRNFGRHYKTFSAEPPVTTSISYLALPTEMINEDVRLSEGSYIILTSYGYNMSTNNRDFVAGFEVDNVLQKGLHVEKFRTAAEFHYTTRVYELVVDKGIYNLKLQFGVGAIGAIALMRDASISIWRTT